MIDPDRLRHAAVVCADGLRLRVCVFDAVQPAGRVVLIAPATGVPARFYYHHAAWLAANGYTTLVWDWRGIGDNAPATLGGYEVTMTGWATLDLPAVVDWAVHQYATPLVGIGHSFGGQAFGLAGRPDPFGKLMLIAAGSGYWGHWPAPRRYLFRGAIAVLPQLARALGYLPGRALGLGADLPRGVALEWFSWCHDPDYLGRWEGHAEFRIPVHSFGFTDDPYAPLPARAWLLERYRNAERTLETVDPREVGLKRIGHLDFFRRHHAETLWPRMLEWLRA